MWSVEVTKSEMDRWNVEVVKLRNISAMLEKDTPNQQGPQKREATDQKEPSPS
jgi:hypothetical protein